jgi:hypothetical protein
MNRTSHIRCLLAGFVLIVGSIITGCSVVMEATRPAPVRLAEFTPGESRDAVVSKLGEPTTSTTDADGASCDLYSLPLSGYGALAKTSIAFGEVVADFFTLGIAEAVSTPTEAITRNKKTPVWFCYRNDALARVTPKHLEGEDLASSDRAAASPPASSARPVGGGATAPATSLPPPHVTPSASVPVSSVPSSETE